MSEYIIEVEYDTFNGTFTQKRREEIVRCMDCKHYKLNTYSHFTCELLMFYAQSNGYCAWGERRADHD